MHLWFEWFAARTCPRSKHPVQSTCLSAVVGRGVLLPRLLALPSLVEPGVGFCGGLVLPRHARPPAAPRSRRTARLVLYAWPSSQPSGTASQPAPAPPARGERRRCAQVQLLHRQGAVPWRSAGLGVAEDRQAASREHVYAHCEPHPGLHRLLGDAAITGAPPLNLSVLAWPLLNPPVLFPRHG